LRSYGLIIVIGVTVCAVLVVRPPHEEVGMVVFTTLIGLWVLYVFVDLAWWLFRAARWLVGLIVRPIGRLFRRDRSDGRTTPDRTGP
jgi:hypothetical protein